MTRTPIGGWPAALFSMIVTTLACGPSGDSTSAPKSPGPAAVASVSVDPPTASLIVGATQAFTATAKDASGSTLTGRTVTWSSSDQSIASLNASCTD
jgi:uncharacterized protein YjdB